MPPSEMTKMDLHREARQCSWQNRVSDRQKTECRMEIYLTMKVKRFLKKDCALHYRDGAVFFHEMFWFMPISPWIMDGHIW